MKRLSWTLALLAGALICQAAIPPAGAGYPPFEKKTLYAKNDLRGKQGPKLVVKDWLAHAKPNTKGKVVLIDFWATWCPPCRAFIPKLNKMVKDLNGDLVAIGVSDEKDSVVSDFLKTHPVDYSVGTDASGTMSKEVGVEGIPHVLVMTPDGVVRWQGFPEDGKYPLTEDILKQVISSWKADHPASKSDKPGK